MDVTGTEIALAVRVTGVVRVLGVSAICLVLSREVRMWIAGRVRREGGSDGLVEGARC